VSLDGNAPELIYNNREPIHWNRLEIPFEDLLGLSIYSVQVHLQITRAGMATYSDWKKHAGFIAFHATVITSTIPGTPPPVASSAFILGILLLYIWCSRKSFLQNGF
jgi:hypothetical protein